MKAFRQYAAALAILGACAGGFAQSAKNAVQCSDITMLDWTGQNSEWGTILSAVIHTSQQKDLIFGVSLETGLYTRTLVRSKSGTSDASKAEAGIEIRVVVDGQVLAEPGVVNFDKRAQELTAKLGGVLEQCGDTNGDGVITSDECTFSDEEIDLVLKTMAAHHFNFILNDLGQGDHAVEVQSRITLGTTVQTGEAEAKACIGKGSLTVDEVRLAQDTEIML